MATKKVKETVLNTNTEDVDEVKKEIKKKYTIEPNPSFNNGGITFISPEGTTGYIASTGQTYEQYSQWLEDQHKKIMSSQPKFTVKDLVEDEEKLLSPFHIGSGKKYGSDRYTSPYDNPNEDEEENEEERADRELREEEEYRRAKSDENLFEKVFNEYDKTKDAFILFKAFLDTNLITLGSSIFSADWRRHYRSIEEAREGFTIKSNTLTDHIKNSISSYFGYTISSTHLDIVREIILDVYMTSPEKFLMISIDTEEVLSDFIRLCKSRNIKIHNSIKELKDINFGEYRRNCLQITLSYISTFNTMFLSNKRQRSITTRTSISKFYDTLERYPVVKYYDETLGDNVININGIEYSKKAFESILELNFEEFMTNIRLESLLEKDIADESVAGTGELKSS